MAQARAVQATFVPGRPTILAGDFNGRPDDPVVGSFEGSWSTALKDGDPRTYPAPAPDREIDFVMWTTNGDLGAARSMEVIQHVVVDEPMASDHRPILAVFELRR